MLQTTLERPVHSFVEDTMLIRLADGIDWLMRASCPVLQTRFIAWTRPPHPGLARGVVVDRARGKATVVADNALVRQPLIVLS